MKIRSSPKFVSCLLLPLSGEIMSRINNIFNISFGGITIKIDAAELPFSGRLREKYSEFISRKQADMNVIFHLSKTALSDTKQPTVSFRRKGSRVNYFIGDILRGYFDTGRSKAELSLCDGQEADWGYAQAHFLMGIYAELLLQQGGMIFHASSAEISGKGFLFVAPSGGGKTTVARMKGWGQVFSDDISCVRKKQKRFYLCGTPWGEPARKGRETLLTQICFLKKSKVFSVQKKASPLCASTLFRFAARLAPTQASDQKILETVSLLAESTPASALSFAKNSNLPLLLSKGDL